MRRRLLRPVAIGLPALAIVTSCVPQEPPRIAASQAILKPDARTLLRQLALNVPDAATNPALVVAQAPMRADTSLATPTAAPPFQAEARSPQDFGRAEDCLTAAIYYEARSQSEDGQRAVAQVVLNRVRDLAFPGSVCGVVYQGSNRRTGCQFSFTCDGSMDRRRDPWAWERSREVAAAALGGAVYAPVGSATHYHATSVLPWWASSLSRIGQIGAHIFYRWQNGMERALAFRKRYAGFEPETGGVGGTGRGEIPTSEVAIHYTALEMVGGVTVHRGGGPSQSARPVAMIAVASNAGVRIHRGVAIPANVRPVSEDIVDEDAGTI